MYSYSGALTTNNMFVKERLGKKRGSFCVINTSWRQTYIITSNTKYQYTCDLESIQDFLMKLDIKPLIHLLEISSFSLNKVILRLTKIMNRADKNRAHF